jgi:ComF family protein
MFKKLVEYFSDLVFLIFPAHCEACGNVLFKNEEIVCIKCLYELPRTNYSYDKENPILNLLAGRLYLTSATALYSFHKDSKFRKLLHKLKYNHRPEIGVILGKDLASEMKQSGNFDDIDFIVPVPLHPKRKKWRGYNQSEEIAKGIAEVLNIAISADNFIRNVETTTQTQKTKDERWQNVAGKFKIVDENIFVGKHLLLVDDVLTTGATLEACGEMLLKIAGVRLSIGVLAKV